MTTNQPNQKSTIAVSTPGAVFDTAWTQMWDKLYLHLLLKLQYNVIRLPQKCSNQYTVRDMTLRQLKEIARTSPQYAPKYVLFIDSDNLLTPEQFDKLHSALETHADIADAVGGWYYIDIQPPVVCAASATSDPLTTPHWIQQGGARVITLEEIQEAYDSHTLLEVTAHMGFGSLLMKWEVLAETGDYAFSPVLKTVPGSVYAGEEAEYLGDDVSFCRRAIARGRRFFIQPDVKLPHLKIKDIPAADIVRRETPELQIEGWMSEAELEWLAATAKSMKTVAEVGSWKGRSTVALLRSVPDDGSVTCIDTWRGSWNEQDTTHREAADGSNAVFDRFVLNTERWAAKRQILRGKSVEVAHALAMGQVVVAGVPDGRFDMVFIDGAHDYESVKADIEAWLPRTRMLICGHDYYMPGVNRAVTELLGVGGKDIFIGADSIWLKFLPDGAHLPAICPAQEFQEATT